MKLFVLQLGMDKCNTIKGENKMKKLMAMLVIGLVMGVVGVGNTARLTLEFDLNIYTYPLIDASGSVTFDNIIGEVDDFWHSLSTFSCSLFFI